MNIKCFIGFHKWAMAYFRNNNGMSIGLQCQYCGIWHKTAIRGSWDYLFKGLKE